MVDTTHKIIKLINYGLLFSTQFTIKVQNIGLLDSHLVGGIPTPLKNDGVRQWEGWHPIYEMEHKIPWFETTNQP